MIFEVLIKKVYTDSLLKQMIIETFNTQKIVMRYFVLYIIKKKKIKSTNDYKNIHSSIIARLDIKHLNK